MRLHFYAMAFTPLFNIFLQNRQNFLRQKLFYARKRSFLRQNFFMPKLFYAKTFLRQNFCTPKLFYVCWEHCALKKHNKY